MSVATTELSRSTQHLIDSRLDTIDRMLLGRVSRQERLEIVREVEAQIFEQLHERGADELSREDVLAVLGRLDPPEAYLPEEAGEAGPVPPRISSRPRAGRSQPVRKGDPPGAKVSGILSLVAMALILLGCPIVLGLVVATNSVAVLYILGGGILALAFIGSILAITLAVYCRLANAWAIVGLVNGILAILASLAVTALILFGESLSPGPEPNHAPGSHRSDDAASGGGKLRRRLLRELEPRVAPGRHRRRRRDAIADHHRLQRRFPQPADAPGGRAPRRGTPRWAGPRRSRPRSPAA